MEILGTKPLSHQEHYTVLPATVDLAVCITPLEKSKPNVTTGAFITGSRHCGLSHHDSHRLQTALRLRSTYYYANDLALGYCQTR